MVVYNFKFQRNEMFSNSEFNNVINMAAIQAGFVIESRIDENQTLFYMGNVFNSELLKKFSSLPYIKVEFDIKRKIIRLGLCYNFLTILGLIFASILISITLYAGITTLELKSIIFPLILLLITFHSFYTRLIPFIKFRNQVLNKFK